MLHNKHISLYMKDYKACRIGNNTCTFFDEFSNALEIDSETVYLMFRVLMRDLKRSGDWQQFEESILNKYDGLPKIIEK